jgi:hypothetical protein
MQPTRNVGRSQTPFFVDVKNQSYQRHRCKKFSATSSLVRFEENKNIFFYLKSALAYVLGTTLALWL